MIIFTIGILFGIHFVSIPCKGNILPPLQGDTFVVAPGSDVNITWRISAKISEVRLRQWKLVETDDTFAEILRDGSVDELSTKVTGFKIIKPATLHLKDVKLRHNGTYEFLMSTTSQFSSPVTVFVAEKPRMTTCSSPVSRNEGDNITCSCQGEGGNPPYPIDVTWLKNGNMIRPVKHYINVLTLSNVSKSDIGTYTCRAETHPLARNEKNITVGVIPNFPPKKPKLTFSPNPAVLGKTLKIECEAAGLPLPSYTITHNENKVVSNDSTHTIKKVENSDGGSYKCVAKNKLGMNSTTDNLKVVATGPATTPRSTTSATAISTENPSTVSSKDPKKSGSNTGVIIGSVIGGLALILIIIVLVWWFKLRGKDGHRGNAIVNSRDNDPSCFRGDNTYESVNDGNKASNDKAGGSTSANPPGSTNPPVVYAQVDKNRKNEPTVTYATLDTMAMKPDGSKKRDNEPTREQTEYASIQFKDLKADLV